MLIMTGIILQQDSFTLGNSYLITWILSSFRYKIMWHVPDMHYWGCTECSVMSFSLPKLEVADTSI
jgi:hypothetical protein